MDLQVREAVERVYRVFGPYGLGDGAAAAEREGGIGPLEARLLMLTPVREIPVGMIFEFAQAPFAGKAALPVIKALLPRLCELVAEEGPSGDAGWAAAGLLRRAGYRDGWPSEEVRSLEGYFATLFDATRRSGGDPVAVLDFVADAGGDTGPLISAWIDSDGAGRVAECLSPLLGADPSADRRWLGPAVILVAGPDAKD